MDTIPSNAKLATGVLVFYSDGTILLGKEYRAQYDAYYWMEFGGKVEKGESLVDAASRETNEETAGVLKITVRQIQDSEDKGYYIDNYNEKSNFFYRMYCLKLEGAKPDPKVFLSNAVGKNTFGKIEWRYFNSQDVLNNTLPGEEKLYSTMLTRLSKLKEKSFLSVFKKTTYTILVDMDGVITNFNKRLVANYRLLHPGEPYVKQEDSENWDTAIDYTNLISPEAGKEINRIYHEPGFYASLEPIPGAIEALTEMVAEGHKVFICTAPSNNTYCAAEKYNWVLQHLGKEWLSRMILTRDKTLIKGDVLIDDKPKITGLMTPEWKQIFYHQPYNKNVDLPRIVNWKDWSQVVSETVLSK